MHGMITSLDDVVGNVTQKLKEVGIYENTILIFSSDNGGIFGFGGNKPLKGNIVWIRLIKGLPAIKLNEQWLTNFIIAKLCLQVLNLLCMRVVPASPVLSTLHFFTNLDT